MILSSGDERAWAIIGYLLGRVRSHLSDDEYAQLLRDIDAVEEPCRV